jgi:hypothetical protein
MAGDAGAILHVCQDATKMVHYPKGRGRCPAVKRCKRMGTEVMWPPKLGWKPEADCPGDLGADAGGSQDGALVALNSGQEDVIASNASYLDVSVLPCADAVVSKVCNLYGTMDVDMSVSYE